MMNVGCNLESQQDLGLCPFQEGQAVDILAHSLLGVSFKVSKLQALSDLWTSLQHLREVCKRQLIVRNLPSLRKKSSSKPFYGEIVDSDLTLTETCLHVAV